MLAQAGRENVRFPIITDVRLSCQKRLPMSSGPRLARPPQQADQPPSQAAAATPLAVISSANSPDSYISIMMSEPPTNSPLT